MRPIIPSGLGEVEYPDPPFRHGRPASTTLLREKYTNRLLVWFRLCRVRERPKSRPMISIFAIAGGTAPIGNLRIYKLIN
jgi:hypothetical protein